MFCEQIHNPVAESQWQLANFKLQNSCKRTRKYKNMATTNIITFCEQTDNPVPELQWQLAELVTKEQEKTKIFQSINSNTNTNTITQPSGQVDVAGGRFSRKEQNNTKKIQMQIQIHNPVAESQWQVANFVAKKQFIWALKCCIIM